MPGDGSVLDDMREAATQLTAREGVAGGEAPLSDAPVGVPDTEVAESGPVEEAPQQGTEPPKGPGRDGRGRFAAGSKPSKPAADPSSLPQEPAQGAPKTPEAAAPGEPATAPLRAPQAWRPELREMWGKVPPEVQSEVVRREREVSQALATSAEARQGWQRFMEVARPYEGMIRAAGRDPVQSAAQLFQASATLQLGTPQQRADMAAAIIMQYGVDLPTLNNVLVRALGGEGAPNEQSQWQAPQPQQMKDPRFDAFLAQLDREAQERQREEINRFSATHEFYNDVRLDMADLIEARNRRRLPMSLDEAYDAAVKLNPELGRVIEQREAAKRVATATAATQRARSASSSIRANPAGSSALAESGGSIREELEASMEELAGR